MSAKALSPLLVLACGLVLGACRGGGRESIEVAVAAGSAASFGAVPPALLVDQAGAATGPASLSGRAWALACMPAGPHPDAPELTAALRDLVERFAGTDVAVVVLAVDQPLAPAGEGAAAEGAAVELEPQVRAALASLAATAGDPTVWTGAEPEVYRVLAEAWRGVTSGDDDDARRAAMLRSFEPRVLAVDRTGAVRGAYDLTSKDGPAALAARLEWLAR